MAAMTDPDTADIFMPMNLDELPAAEVHAVVVELVEKSVQEGLEVSKQQCAIHEAANRESRRVIVEAHDQQVVVVERAMKRQRRYMEVMWKL